MTDVAVVTLTADNGETMLVVVRREPLEAYASKNQKHLCFMKAGKLVRPTLDPKKPEDKLEPISLNEEGMIWRAYFGLRGLLGNLFDPPIHSAPKADT
jgi:hypothetical protein